MLELLNSEGPILRALRIDEKIILIDEKRVIIESLSEDQFLAFIKGELEIVDSLKRKINFISFGADKPTFSKICEYFDLKI